MKDDEAPGLDAPSKWGVDRDVREVERRVRCEPRHAADLRVVLFEDQHLAGHHRREVAPAVLLREGDQVDLAGSAGIPDLARDKIPSSDGPRIAEGKGRVQNRAVERSPDVDDAVAL